MKGQTTGEVVSVPRYHIHQPRWEQAGYVLAELQGRQWTGPTGHHDDSIAVGQGWGKERHKGEQGLLLWADDTQHSQGLSKAQKRPLVPSTL